MTIRLVPLSRIARALLDVLRVSVAGHFLQ